MKALAGDECVPLVVNGCCGNINPWNPFDPDHDDDHRTMGKVFAATARKVMETLTYESVTGIGFASPHLPIPIRPLDLAALKDAHEFLKQNPDLIWADRDKGRVDRQWFAAANLVSVELLRRRSEMFDYEVQAFRIGGVAIVGLPGEPFVEGQLRIKMASPAALTLVAHCVNQYVGYIPVPWAFKHGGHEVNTSTWAKLVPEALDTIIDAATDLVRGLFVS